MRKLAATTMGLGLLVSTAQAQTAPTRYSAPIDIAPFTEQVPTVAPGQTITYRINPTSEPVVSVTRYDVQVWSTSYATLQNSVDDILVQDIPVTLSGPNPTLAAEWEHTRTMTAPTAEGKYALCTEAQFDGHIQESRLCHAFTVAAPVAAPAPVAPVIPFVPEKSEVDAWLEAKIEFTDGGVFNPRYNSTFVPEQQKLVYEDRAHFAVLGTPGYVNGIRVETDPCKPAEPCVAPLREELYIAGATLEGKVVHASGTDTTVTKIQPRQELVAQYDGEDRNMRTHLVYQEQARNRGTDLSYVPRRIAGHSIINNEGNLFAVEAVLWGIVGTDRNHDGQITSDEQDCVPIAWKTQYVQIVPKGHEGAAFLGGVVVGLAGGYLLSAYGGPESSGDRPLSFPEFPLGTYTSGRQGNTVE